MNGIVVNGQAIKGTVLFSQATLNDPLVVTVNITGLQVVHGNNYHGLHVHQNAITVVSTVASTSK